MALEDAWLFLKADVDYDFGLTHRRQPTEEESYVQGGNRFPRKPLSGGYNLVTRDIKLNPAKIYSNVKRQLEQAGLDREPSEDEIMQAIRDISRHEAVHAAHHNLEGANWFEEDGSASKDTPVTHYDMEMVAHLLDFPNDPHDRMVAMRRHPDFYKFPKEKQQYIENYLGEVKDNRAGLLAAAQKNHELQYGERYKGPMYQQAGDPNWRYSADPNRPKTTDADLRDY